MKSVGSALMWALLLVLPCTTVAQPPAQYTFTVAERKALSRDWFVQGLEIVDDSLYLSSGLYGRSALLRLDFATMQPELTRRLNARVFAEGLTVLGQQVFQLTWRNRALLVFDKEQLRPLKTLPLPGEGWGLTNNGHELIYSDGSEHLYFITPDSGRRLRQLTVTEHGQPLKRLNELEWIDGKIWANVWQTQRIVMIDPETGTVTGSVNLAGLLPAIEYHSDTDVLNGIAQDRRNGAIWVTGKRWPWLYRIEITAKKPERDATSGAVSR